jgi:hypothetical protein
MTSSKLLKELKLLTAIQKKSVTSNKASEKILLLAFNLRKPIFSVAAEQSEATQQFLKSLPFFFDTFHRLSIRLEPDLVNYAQRCCSGFQYLADELSTADKIEVEALLGGPFSVVTEYIKNCLEEDIKPEYPSGSVAKEDLSKIPKTHWWWFVTPAENDD